MKIITQIYEIQKPGEAEKLIELGVDHIGSVILDRENWCDPAIREVVRLTAGTSAKSSLIPLFGQADDVLQVLDYYQPDIIHFCENIPLLGEAGKVMNPRLEQLLKLQGTVRERFPELRIMRSIPIPPAGSGATPRLFPEKPKQPAPRLAPGPIMGTLPAATPGPAPDPGEQRSEAVGLHLYDDPLCGASPVDLYETPGFGSAAAAYRDGIGALVSLFTPLSDFFMTDTVLVQGGSGGDAVQPVAGFVGITGTTCDWELATWLVQISPRPVILAGGLGPENVSASIGRVRPAGVDSCTRTNARDPRGRPIRFWKDFNKVSRFIEEVRRAEGRL